jgi:hypothetical protein
MVKSRNRDDSATQIGILIGAEWPVKDIAEHLGLSQATVFNHKKRHGDAIQLVAGWTRLAIGRYVKARIEKAEADLAERKKSIHEKGYRVIEKKLDMALGEETVVLDATDLRAAEMGIERTEGKPLDRKAILERSEHIYRVEVDGSDLDAVLGELAQINEMRRKLLPPAEDTTVRDAELVKTP